MICRCFGQVALILSVLLMAGCGPQKGQWTSSRASHVPELPDTEAWSFQATEGRIIETPHYRVYTTVRDALLLEKLPAFLEATYQQYLAFLPGSKGDQEPLEIYLFQRRKEWEAYTKQNLGARAQDYLKIRAGGYSYNGISVAYLLGRYHTFGVLAHEGFHQFVNTRLAHRIPAWMEEGLACNFEAHFWRGGRPRFVPDLNEFRLQALQRALRGNSLFELNELLSMNAGKAVSLPAERTATFYAQTWALTRFLQEWQKGKYRLAFQQMLADAADGANLYSQDRALDIFESYFKMDVEEMTEDFVLFARLLANRQIEPGMEVYMVSADELIRTTTLSPEQIEQAREDTKGQTDKVNANPKDEPGG